MGGVDGSHGSRYDTKEPGPVTIETLLSIGAPAGRLSAQGHLAGGGILLAPVGAVFPDQPDFPLVNARGP